MGMFVHLYNQFGVRICVAMWFSGDNGGILGSGPEVLSSIPTLATFHLAFHLPPTSLTSPPNCNWVPGICWGAISRPSLMK